MQFIHTTLNSFLDENNDLKDYILNVLKECGMPNGCSLNSYIVQNESTILIYSEFDKRPNTYAVDAIYTKDKMRNRGSAKKLLSSLPSFGSLYFDTYSDVLIYLLKSIGGYEEDVFKNKPSKQFILDT